MTSYTKHGQELEALATFTQLQDFLDHYTIPYVWGGDFYRLPAQLLQEAGFNGLGLQALPPLGECSTCSNGGLIDYFVSHVSETVIVQAVRKIEGSPLTPHYLVECKVPRNLKDTIVMQQEKAPAWPEVIGPLLAPYT